MAERMWTYPELKFVTAHQYKMDAQELAKEANVKFHLGDEVRSRADIEKILHSKTIFNKDKKR
jgi:hypothetical protein